MSLITLNKGVNIKDLNGDFYNRLKEVIEDYGKPVIFASAFRGWVHQFDLWIGYKILGNGKPANEPGRSAHNFGLAVDMHPSNGLEEDYVKLGEIAKKYDINRSVNPKERWHFQDSTFKAIPMTMYFIIAGSLVFFSVI